MEARIRKYREQVSPERAKVWKEKSPKYRQNRKVPVLYYLCRNRQLEHPHFMEVPLSSRDGLFLRDVIDRLNALRGRGIASLYSWSCKRSYKNGFVWHDLSEDDLILPAHGSEYVLKGSELFCESNSDRFSMISNVKLHSLKQLPEPDSCRSHDESSSSSSMNERERGRNSQEDELSPGQQSGSSDVSPESRHGKSSSQSLPMTEYKIYKADGLANASTQTEEYVRRPQTRETCTRGVSTEDESLESECQEIYEAKVAEVEDNSEICEDTVSPPLPTSSPSSSGGKTDTLESLIRADASKINSFRYLEDESFRMHTNPRLKASNLLMQLISCGSISVKNHSLDLIPSNKARFSHTKFLSPLFSTSVMLGELDCRAENPKVASHRSEDREYFSGSISQSKMVKEEDRHNDLNRSSSFEAWRTCKNLKSPDMKESSSSGNSKSIPLSVKVPSSMRSPISDRSRNSMDRINNSGISPVSSNSCSKRITASSEKKQSRRIDSYREEEKVIKIEERLASGARVIIQSKASSNIVSNSS